MTIRFASGSMLSSVLMLSLACSTAAQAQSPVEIARRGKAATALLELDAGKGYATAFCVDSSGFFITNAHVIQNAGADKEFTLILHPGQEVQAEFKAQVVRQDGGLDLALLKVDVEKEFATLELATGDGISELMELIAFGYPFGKELAVDRSEYPAISINRGTITALRRKDGKLHRIQLDAEVNPGNSGGPVLDEKGKVIGVVVGGIVGTGVYNAIPVIHVEQFLARPDIEVALPELEPETLNQPATFEARVRRILPSKNQLTADLLLTTPGSQEPRRFPMEEESGVFRAEAVPAPGATARSSVEITAYFNDGTLSARMQEIDVRIGERTVRLSEIKRLSLKASTKSVLRDGSEVEGPVAGLDEAKVLLGGLPLDPEILLRAGSLTTKPRDDRVAIRYTVVIREGETEVGKVAGVLGLAGGSVGDDSVSGILPPRLTQDLITLKVPSEIKDVCVGGGGRYLALYLERIGKLAIFDVNVAEIVHYIPISGDVRFAAGLDELLIYSPSSGVIQRWDLATAKREAVAKLDVSGNVISVAMGHMSHGPLLLTTVDQPGPGRPYQPEPIVLVDVATLEKMPIGWVQTGGHGGPVHLTTSRLNVRAAANGQAFGIWRSDTSPSGLSLLEIEGSNALRHRYEHKTVGHVIPGPEGRILYTARGLYSAELRPMQEEKDPRQARAHLPATNGQFYLSWGLQFDSGSTQKPSEKRPSGVTVHMSGDPRSFATLADIPLPAQTDAYHRGSFPYDKRVHFIAEANLIVAIPDSNKELILHKFDVEEALQKSDLDYLFVDSQAPGTATKREAFLYQLRVRSRDPGLRFKLESSPPGMSISESGEIRWDVPPQFSESSVSVIVSVKDANDQECFHSFAISIRG